MHISCVERGLSALWRFPAENFDRPVAPVSDWRSLSAGQRVLTVLCFAVGLHVSTPQAASRVNATMHVFLVNSMPTEVSALLWDSAWR